jgi:GABA permease
MSKRLLVVAASGVSADSAGRAIDRNYGDDVAVHIVAPASGLSRLDWLANAEDGARGDAEARADQIADAVHTDNVDKEVGDTDPVQAIRDALTTFPADEIVVLTKPDDEVTWLEEGTTEEARARFDLPVRHLVIDS